MSQGYINWYILRNTLETGFGIAVRWTAYGYLEFSGPKGTVIVTKSNNMLYEFVEEVLCKLGIDKREFENKRKELYPD